MQFIYRDLSPRRQRAHFPDSSLSLSTLRDPAFYTTLKMRSRTIFAALFGSTLAAPMDHRLEDIQCRCLSFSTDAKPTLCTYMESHAFDFHTANSLASNYDLKVQFASESTIDKVLSIHRPLPSEVLQSISEGKVANVEPSSLLQRENKIVCGFGDEVKRLGSHDLTFDPECHFIGYIVGGMTLFTLIYVLIASAWARYVFESSSLCKSANGV